MAKKNKGKRFYQAYISNPLSCWFVCLCRGRDNF